MKLDPKQYRTQFEPFGLPFLEKCWQLPDWAFISAIRTAVVVFGQYRQSFGLYDGAMPLREQVQNGTATRWDIAAVIAGHPEDIISQTSTQDYPGVPPKLILAKARILMKRGIIEGCACGCRGDFSVIDQNKPNLLGKSLFDLFGGAQK